MSNEIHDACGVVAFAYMDALADPQRAARRTGRAADSLYAMLLNLQHRGQLSAGITTYDRDRPLLLRTHKALGVVSRAFAPDIQGRKPLEILDGLCGIGHTRYATCGVDDVSHAQPFERWHGRPWKWFAVCFNGTIANFSELKQKLTLEQQYHMVHDTDTEVILHYLSYALRGTRKPTFRSVFAQLAARFDGAYNIALINADGDMVIARDPLGFRPMCYGFRDGTDAEGRLWAAASESVALANLGFRHIEFLRPGSLLHIHDGRVRTTRFARSDRTAYCFFEWVYFASAGSVLDAKSVYLARAALGRELARIERKRWQRLGVTDADRQNMVVVPVPDAAKPAADSLAYELGVPSLEGLLRNRYVGRTFIESANRYERALRKYTPLPEVLHGKSVLLVEDSIVRLTTLRAIIRQMREYGGAREIHVRITCPPIIAPCFYGIDIPTCNELWAYRYLQKPADGLLPDELADRMARDIGAESLVYLPVDAIPPCIGFRRSELCMACVTGQYPTAWGRKDYQAACQIAREDETTTANPA
jgi:amidophosphoribosyltransferase